MGFLRNLSVVSLLLCLLISLSFGLTEKEVKLYSGDSYNFEGYNIYIVHASSSSTLMVKVDSATGFLDYPLTLDEFSEFRATLTDKHFSKSYPSTRVGDIKISLKQICFDLNEKSCGRINDLGKYVEPSYSLDLSYYKPELKVETSYGKSNFWLGDEFFVTTTITNEGDVDIRDLEYVENYPDTIKITPVDDVRLFGDGVKYKRTFLKKGDSTKFRYKIKLLEKLAYSLKGEFSYTYNDVMYSDFGLTKKLDLKDVYTVAMVIPSSVDVDDEFELDLNFKNTAEDSVDFGLSLVFPEGVTLKDSSNFKLIDGYLVFSGRLDEGEIFEDTLQFIAETGGDNIFELYVDSVYLIENPSEIISKKLIIKGDVDLDDDLKEFEIKLNVDADSSNIHSKHILEGDLAHFEVFLTKGEFDLENIFVNVTCSDFNFNFISEKSLLAADDSYTNFLFALNMPLVNQTSDLTFNAYVEATIDGVSENKSVETSFTLYDLDDALTLKRSVPSKIVQGGTGLVSVSLKNNVDRPFMGIKARDIIPSDFVYKDVRTENIINLQPLDEVVMYTYEIKAPYYINESSIVKTILLYDDLVVMKNDTLNSFVDVKDAELLVSTEIEGSLFVGGVFTLEVQLKNSGDLSIRNILVDFPLSTGADLILLEDSLSGVDKLDQGEDVSFYMTYDLKDEGTINLTGGHIRYTDEFGNRFTELISNNSFEVSSGVNDCFITAEKKLSEVVNGSYNSSDVPFQVEFFSFCDVDLKVNVNYPRLSFILPADSKKLISFNEFNKYEFSGSDGTEYSFSDGVSESVSISNSVFGSFDIISDVKTTAVFSSSDISNLSDDVTVSSSSSSDSIFSDVDDSRSELLNSVSGSPSMIKFAGAVFGILLVIFSMVFVMKFVKKLTSKVPSYTDVDSSLVDSDVLVSNKINILPKSTDKLVNFINSERQKNVPEIDIEKKLFNAGWTKEVIDEKMH